MPSSMSPKDIARALHRLREHAGFSQTQAGRMLDLPQQRVSAREHDGLIYAHEVPKWVEVYGASVFALYETSPMGKAPRGGRSVNWEVQDLYQALSAEQQALLIGLMRNMQEEEKPALALSHR